MVSAKLVLGAFFTLVPLWLSAQFYSIGQDPAAIRWKQIKTDHFRVIYPSEFENRAQYVTNILEKVYDSATYILNYKPARVPVILHNREITPNALTIWAPRRIELYTCPPQNLYAQDWLEQLAIHEYEHVIQFDRMNKGATKALWWLLGEMAAPVIAGIYVPAWFYEGDAVFAETVLSKSGRGRLPEFSMDIRAHLLADRQDSYDKAAFGSFRHYVPDHYVLGYHLVTNTRRRYGLDAWNQALDEVARKPYSITPFDRGLKSTTGKGKVALFRETMRDMDSIWRRQDDQNFKTPYTLYMQKSPGDYVRYKFPYYINDSLVLAEKMSLDDIPRFVLIDRKGNEQIVCTPGFFSSETFSFGASAGFGSYFNKPGTIVDDEVSLNSGILCWAEKEADPRWQNRSYSVIKTYNFSTGKIRKLTSKSRYFSPAVAPDGNSILAVEITEDNIFSLVQLDSKNGRVAATLFTTASESVLTPSWSADGKKIVFITLGQNGKSVRQTDLSSGKTETLFHAGFTEVNNPVYFRNFIFVNASWSGIENIFAFDTLTKQLYQVTSSRFGACNAQFSPAGDKIIYSDYHSNGYAIAEIPFDPSSWKKIEDTGSHSAYLFSSLLKPMQFTIDSSSVKQLHYKSEKYSRLKHFLRFHSWAPFYLNAMNSDLGPGISLMSQNDLSTTTMVAGYEWDYAELTGRGRLNLKWEGWYPVIDLDGTFGNRTQYETSSDGLSNRFTWNESRLSLGVGLPLFFNHGKCYSGLSLQVRSSLVNITGNTSLREDKLQGSFNTLGYRMVWYRYMKQSVRDLYPRWGIYTDLNFRHSPFSSNDLGSIGSVATTLFVPGLSGHHGLRAYAAYQQRNRGDYAYADLISMPRGYHYMSSEKAISLKLTYKMPVAYPDLALGPVAYIKRIKAAFFYDYSRLDDKNATTEIQSFGTEITSDMHLLRFIFPVDPGIRMGFRTDDKKWFAEPVFSINLTF